MARILYGVHGTGHGHAMRGLTIARKLPGHDFLFVANDDALTVLEPEFPVFRLPNLGTKFHDYRVDMPATVKGAIPLLLKKRQHIRTLLRLIDDFRPDVCMADLEFFTPRAARLAGLPCLTLDHQHIISCCEHNLPPSMRWDAFVQGLSPRYLFPPTEHNIIVSFYAPKVLPQYNALVVPPILRDSVIALRPRDDGHIVVYQSNSTHRNLIDFLKQSTSRKCYVFGYSRDDGMEDNIIFMKKSERGFLELLEGASYIIQGGSHTLMSEALYLGKPVFSLPLGTMLEQRFNALYLERLNYGMAADIHSLDETSLEAFEQRLPEFRKDIAKNNFCGNNLVFSLVDEYARKRKIDAVPQKTV